MEINWIKRRTTNAMEIGKSIENKIRRSGHNSLWYALTELSEQLVNKSLKQTVIDSVWSLVSISIISMYE